MLAPLPPAVAMRSVTTATPRRMGWQRSENTPRGAEIIGSVRMSSFEILNGLPPYGPAALPFPEAGRGAFREGLIVRFHGVAGDSWVGNFQKGFYGVTPSRSILRGTASTGPSSQTSARRSSNALRNFPWT